MTLDPTLEEMESFLRQKTGGLIDWRETYADDVARIAIHYFASHNHSGQFSNLYQAICRIDYNSMGLEMEDEDEVQLMYQLLTNEYVK